MIEMLKKLLLLHCLTLKSRETIFRRRRLENHNRSPVSQQTVFLPEWWKQIREVEKSAITLMIKQL